YTSLTHPPNSTLCPYPTLFRSLATLGCNARRSLHGLQTLEGGLNHVHRVGGAIALGQNVLYAGDFQDGAHGTTGNHTGIIRSRRSEEHTSELQSRENIVCRLLR